MLDIDPLLDGADIITDMDIVCWLYAGKTEFFHRVGDQRSEIRISQSILIDRIIQKHHRRGNRHEFHTSDLLSLFSDLYSKTVTFHVLERVKKSHGFAVEGSEGKSEVTACVQNDECACCDASCDGTIA